jgi:hypothetical protein
MKYVLVGLLAFSIFGSNLAFSAEAKINRPFDGQLMSYCKSRGKAFCEKGQPETFVQGTEMELLAACKDFYRKNHCDMVRDSLHEDQRDTVIKCEMDNLCKSVSDVNEIQCRIDGIKAQFTFENLAIMGATSLAAGVFTTGSLAFDSVFLASGFLVYEASEKEKSCNQDFKFKKMAVQIHNLSLVEGERPLDIEGKDSALLKLPCSELQKFLSTRLDTLIHKRGEEKRWALNPQDVKVSPAAKALQESLKSNRCLNQVAIKEKTCRSITALLTNAAIGVGSSAATAAATPTVTSAATSAVAKLKSMANPKPLPDVPPATRVETTTAAINEFERIGVKVDTDPKTVEHSFSAKSVKKNLRQSKIKFARAKELKFEVIRAKERLEKVQSTLKEKYSNRDVDINDEKYLNLITEKKDLESFINEAAIELGEKRPEIIGYRTYQLDSSEIQALKEKRGGRGGAVYQEVMDPKTPDGEFLPIENKIIVTSNTRSPAETFKHELSHASTYANTGMYKQDEKGNITSDPFLFQVKRKSGKGNGKPVDSYVEYQHGSEASAYRAGAKTASALGEYETAMDRYTVSNIMAARNIKVLEQAQDQVRKLIDKGEKVGDPSWVPNKVKDVLPNAIKVTEYGITFNVKLKDGYSHTLTMNRPPEVLVGKKPDPAKIEQYLEFMIRAQEKVIDKNNVEMQQLQRDASKINK